MTTKLSPAQPGRHGYACLLRLPEVMQRVGLSRSEVYRRVASSDFPQPVKLGRVSAWPERDITEWCEAHIAARDAKRRAA